MTKQENETYFDDIAMKFCELYRLNKFPTLFHTPEEESAYAVRPNDNVTLFAKKWSKFCKTEVFPNVACAPKTNLQHRTRLALTGRMFGPDVGNIVEFCELGKIVLSPPMKLVSLPVRLSRLSRWVEQRKSVAK